MSSWSRRRFCASSLLGWAAASTAGCELAETEPLRIGVQVFPGYEFLFLARTNGQLQPRQVRLVESPTASASIRALGTGAIDGACLTLDEVLTARGRGIPLAVIAVLDVSVGADVVLAHRDVGGLPGLRGRTLGVEQSAVGAIMLDALLMRAGLSLRDLTIRHVGADAHEAEFLARRVDAVVSFEPAKSRLVQAGAEVVYSSADIPGRILDVIAVRSAVLDTHASSLRHLLDAHFGARDAYRSTPERYRAAMAPRLRLEPAQVDQAYAELDLPDRAQNQAWFADDAARLALVARELSQIMRRAGLLSGQAEPPAPLFDGRWV